MELKRLQELAGIQINEGPPQTTWDNPLVTTWETGESKDYPEQGLSGHMHLTTAQNIHQFKIGDLAAQLKKAGVDKRIKAGKVWLELSKWTKKEIDAGGGRQKKDQLKESDPFNGDDSDLDWGDELIEDLNLLLSEVERMDAENGFEQLKNGLVDLISQYDRKN